MKLNILFYSLITLTIISCKNNTSEQNNESPENDKMEVVETPQKMDMKQIKNKKSKLGNMVYMKRLQGEWKEEEYPFRKAIFKGSTVKFIEEGVAEEPQFEEFTVSNECPYMSGNSKTNSSNDMYILMVKDKTCQKIEISSETVTFSGVEDDYKIVYKREN